MRRLPYEYFLRYLLLIYGTAQALKRLRDLAYPPPPENIAQALRQELQETRPSHLTIANAASRDWLTSMRIVSIFNAHPSVTRAYELVTDVRCRHVLEILLISGMSAENVAHHASEIIGRTISEDTVMYFEHYFWNRSWMTREDWREFLLEPIVVNGKPSGYKERYKDGNDLFRVFLGDGDYGLYKLGARPQITKEGMLDEVIMMAFMKMVDVKADPNTESNARKFSHLWQVFNGALDQRGQAGEAMAQVQRHLHEISLKLREHTIRDVRDYMMSAAGPTPITQGQRIVVERAEVVDDE